MKEISDKTENYDVRNYLCYTCKTSDYDLHLKDGPNIYCKDSLKIVRDNENKSPQNICGEYKFNPEYYK